MMKLKDLNDAIWYRTLKVVYWLLVIVFIIAGVTFSSENMPIKSPWATSASCDDGRTINLSELSSYEPFEISLSDELHKDINWKCYYNPDDAINLTPTKLVQLMLEVNRSDISYYQLIYDVHGSWGGYIATILSIFVGIVILFEIIRRVFYYIVLGTFKPKE